MPPLHSESLSVYLLHTRNFCIQFHLGKVPTEKKKILKTTESVIPRIPQAAILQMGLFRWWEKTRWYRRMLPMEMGPSYGRRGQIHFVWTQKFSLRPNDQGAMSTGPWKGAPRGQGQKCKRRSGSSLCGELIPPSRLHF